HFKIAHHPRGSVARLLVAEELKGAGARGREGDRGRIADLVINIQDVPGRVISQLRRVVVGLDVIHVRDGDLGNQVVVLTASIADGELYGLADSQAHGPGRNRRVGSSK